MSSTTRTGATFALLTNDDFDITALSYSWQYEVTLTAAEQREADLWNEGREGFSWADDCERAADMLTAKLLQIGFRVDNPAHLVHQVQRLAEPGPPLERRSQLLFDTTKVATCACGMWPVEEYGERCPSCSHSLVVQYLDAATEALSRPPQYRAGLEAKMRTLWKDMSAAQQAEVERQFGMR